MANLRPTAASSHCQPNTFIFKDLSTCDHASLRDNTVQRSLQPPYSGPHSVICHDDKTLTLMVKGKESRISIDRVKLAYLMTYELTFCSQDSSAANLPRPAVQQVQPAPPSEAEVETPKPVTEELYKTRSRRRVQFHFPPSTLVGKLFLTQSMFLLLCLSSFSVFAFLARVVAPSLLRGLLRRHKVLQAFQPFSTTNQRLELQRSPHWLPLLAHGTI